MLPSRPRPSCTDSTGDRTDGTRGAGIIRRPGPRTGPRPRPCVPGILLLCVNAADDMDPRLRADRAPGPTVDLHVATHTVRLADVRICRRQGLTGLPWCAGVPVRRACRTGTVPLAVELIEGHGAGGEREPGRDARMPPGSRTGLRDGRAAGRVPAVPGRSGAGRRTPARNHRAGRGSGRRPDARERRGGAGRCGPGSPGYRRVRLPGASRPVVPSR